MPPPGSSTATASAASDGLTPEEQAVLARIQRNIDQSAATNYGRTVGDQRQESRETAEKAEPLEAAALSHRLEPSDNLS